MTHESVRCSAWLGDVSHDCALRNSTPFHDARWLPSAFARRQDGRWFGLRPVEAHHEIDGTVGRGEPVRFLVRTGAVFLDVEGERAVLVHLHAGQHRRIDEVAIDRAFDQQL